MIREKYKLFSLEELAILKAALFASEDQVRESIAKTGKARAIHLTLMFEADRDFQTNDE